MSREEAERRARVKRFLDLLTKATLATGVVIEVFAAWDDNWMEAMPVDDLSANRGDICSLHWNGQAKRWEHP